MAGERFTRARVPTPCFTRVIHWADAERKEQSLHVLSLGAMTLSLKSTHQTQAAQNQLFTAKGVRDWTQNLVQIVLVCLRNGAGFSQDAHVQVSSDNVTLSVFGTGCAWESGPPPALPECARPGSQYLSDMIWLSPGEAGVRNVAHHVCRQRRPCRPS